MNYSELSDFEFTQRLAPPPPSNYNRGKYIYFRAKQVFFKEKVWYCTCKEAAIGRHFVPRPSIGRCQNYIFYLTVPGQWQKLSVSMWQAINMSLSPYCLKCCIPLYPVLPLVRSLLLVLLLVGMFTTPASRTVSGRSLFHPSRKQLSFYSELCRHWSEFCYLSFYWMVCSVILLLELYLGDYCSTPVENNHQ
jgi:hypothetical protein